MMDRAKYLLKMTIEGTMGVLKVGSVIKMTQFLVAAAMTVYSVEPATMNYVVVVAMTGWSAV